MSRIPAWFVWILAFILLLTVLTPGSHLARDHFECSTCASTQTTSQWRWGAYWPGRSLKLSGSWEAVTLSKFHADWLSTTHAHHWFYSKRSGAYALGINKWSLTNLRISLPQWLKHYESDDGFRGWIQQQVIAGELAQSDLVDAAKPEYFASSGRLPNLGDAWHWKYKESLGTRP